MALKIIYIILIGIFVALFVGLGIDTFYKGPTVPDYNEISKPGVDDSRYKSAYEDFDAKRKVYERNVSIMVIIAAVLIAVGSIASGHKIPVLSDGLLLGAMFTLIYGIMRGFSSDNEVYRFIATSIGLALVLGVGYLKFVKPEQLLEQKK